MKHNLKHKFYNRNGVVHSYDEVVKMQNGIVTCEKDSTVKFLESRGFVEMPPPQAERRKRGRPKKEKLDK